MLLLVRKCCSFVWWMFFFFLSLFSHIIYFIIKQWSLIVIRNWCASAVLKAFVAGEFNDSLINGNLVSRVAESEKIISFIQQQQQQQNTATSQFHWNDGTETNHPIQWQPNLDFSHKNNGSTLRAVWSTNRFDLKILYALRDLIYCCISIPNLSLFRSVFCLLLFLFLFLFSCIHPKYSAIIYWESVCEICVRSGEKTCHIRCVLSIISTHWIFTF